MTEPITTDEQAIDVLSASLDARALTLHVETRSAGAVTVDRALFDAYRQPGVDVEVFADWLEDQVADVLPVAYTVMLPGGERVYVSAGGEDDPGTGPAGVEQSLADRVEQQLATVAAIARDLQTHIDTRAHEIALPQIRAIELDAERRIKALQDEIAFEQQRREDVIAEFQRQLNAQAKSNERLTREAKDLRAAVKRVEEDRDIWRRAAESEAQGGKTRAEMLARVECVLAKLRDLADGSGGNRASFPHDMAYAAKLLDSALKGGSDA